MSIPETEIRKRSTATAEARKNPVKTHRDTVKAMEDLLYVFIPVLDHGFVRVIDYMGSDHAVVQAARTSYGSGTKSVRGDQGLINHLMRERHTSPSEMAEIKLHCKMPIFVARQWIRHRTANVNEYSARYSILDGEFYCPEPEDLAAQSSTNRQGREETLSPKANELVLATLKTEAFRDYVIYEQLLGTAKNKGGMSSHADSLLDLEDFSGIARELARMNLPLSVYTQWYWKIDVHNLIHFLGLRTDPHAQLELRKYAQVIEDVFAAWMPFTFEAYLEHRKYARTFSRTAMKALKRMLDGKVVTQKGSGLNEREWTAAFGDLI